MDKVWKQHKKIIILGAVITLLVPVAGSALNLERLVMPGEVIKGHAEYEDECSLCHKLFKKGSQNRLCLKCHEKVAADMAKGFGFHGQSKNVKDTGCKHCHTDHKGRDANIVLMDREIFDHMVTDFPLKGKHKKLKCDDCHTPKAKYRDAASECVDCHKEDDVHLGRLGGACDKCHVELTWRDTSKARFDHEKTNFFLNGKHEKVACNSCHPNGSYKKTPNDCFSCHRLKDIHNGSYGRECKTCHTPKDWKNTTFNHDKTEFILEGKHRKVDCDSCHKGPIYDKKLDKTCYGCHKDDDEHNSRYGRECKTCHTPIDWQSSFFNHDKTEFELNGKHLKVDCEICHRGPIYDKKLDKSCYGCHKIDDEHKGRYGKECKTCHTTADWKKSIFKHDKKMKKICYDCHKQDDAHRGQQGKRCGQCHNDLGWRIKVFFDHDLTKFPLIGLHAIASCEACHLEATYKDTRMDCMSCHNSDDEHKRSLGPKCGLCHNPNDWRLWRFNHDSQTDFPLDGAHEGLECKSCHRKPVKREIRLSTTCSGCHKEDDIHRGVFGIVCERCHTTNSFSEIMNMN